MDAARLLETFFELVRIDSPSRSEAAVAAYSKERLESLGFSVRFDDSCAVTGSNTGNLIAHLAGTRPGHIILSAHMDCVEPCVGVVPVLLDGVIYSEGETVLGADDKAGLSAIFEALRSVIEAHASRPDITVLLTTCEELSLLGASAVSADLFAGNPPCFVLDADGAPGTIIIGSPFHYTLEAQFSGRAAHAGVEPEKGVSTIQMAAHAIESMKLGRIDECTTANIGMIEGGREVNIVPDTCVIRGECRSLYEDRVDTCRAQITQACEHAAEQFGGEVVITWRLDYPGVLYDKDDPLVQSLVAAAQTAGLEPHFEISGGGADTNNFKAKGARAITLGTGMGSFHSTDEFISVEDLNALARYCETIITVGNWS